MNKKLAMLMFAIGLGAASAPAFADACQGYCQNAKKWCLDNTTDKDACMTTFIECMEAC